MAWGDNLQGQLGIGSTTDQTKPVIVSALSNIKQISGGAYDTWALDSSGNVWHTGNNNTGVGLGTTRQTFAQLSGVSNVEHPFFLVVTLVLSNL